MVDSVFLTFPLVDMTVPLDGELPVRAGTTTPIRTVVNEPGGPANILIAARRMGCSIPVSYTHLTLPTILLV